MRFRSKLLLSFVGVALATNAVLLTVQYFLNSQQLRQRIASQVLSIAVDAALSIDAEKLAALKGPDDQNSDAYRDLEGYLRDLRDANRRRDVHVKFIYTLHRDANNPAIIRFGVDAEEPGPDKSDLGDVYDTPDEFVFNGDAPFVFPELSTDAWGTWVTAQAPIRDRAGQCIGLVGVDVSAADVIAAEERMLRAGALGVLAAMLLAVVASGALASRVARPLRVIREGVLAIGRGRLDTVVPLPNVDEFGEVGQAINDMTVGLLQRESLKGALARYVSSEVTQAVLESGEVRVEGERRRVTILFADLRGFTSMSDQVDPEQVVAMLNDFYGGMIEAVMSHRGFLNKFLGDGLMAMFGAPRDDDRQELHALQAARAMIDSMRDLRARWQESSSWLHGVDLRIGIGIHAGDAVVGNVGSDERIEYTAIGDTVNLASRLEAATKEIPGVDLLMTETVHDAVKDQVETRPMGELKVRGKRAPVTVYTVATPPQDPTDPPPPTDATDD